MDNSGELPVEGRADVGAATTAKHRSDTVAHGAVITVLLSRLIINSQARIVYPFLPAISRGLGVPLETASLLLSVRSFAAMVSPAFGMLSDRIGRLRLMLAGIAGLAVGALLAVVAPAFGWALVAFTLLGLAKASYDPAAQAYVSDMVPYTRRGRILGLLELSWSGAWLLGVPATGFLIAAYGWRSPFLVIGLLGLGMLIVTARLNGSGLTGDGPAGHRHGEVSADSEQAGRDGPLNGAAGWSWSRLHAVARPILHGSLGVALSVNLLQVLANENLFIVYGAWLESRFGLSITALGLVSTVVAIAELMAEGVSAGIVDRMGKRRAVLVGLVLSVVAYLVLPLTTGTLPGALAGIGLMFLTFEFSVVSTLPLVSELAPRKRATVMALNLSAAHLGRLIGSLIGPRLWLAGGLSYNALVSAAVVGLATVILFVAVREHHA